MIDEVRPYLQVSLHGTDLGGSWVQLTKDVPGLAEPFAKSAAELHIPVETAASDAAGWPASGPGVHVMPAPGSDAAYPSMPDDARHSTWYHAHRYGGLTAVVEVPMWASDLVDDPTPHPAPAAAMRRLARRLLRDALQVEAVLAEALPRLQGPDGPLLRAAKWALELVPGLADDWVRTPPPNTTMAYVGSVDAFGRRLPLRAAAMLLRVLAGGRRPRGAAPRTARRHLERRLRRALPCPLGSAGAPGRAPEPYGDRGGPPRARRAALNRLLATRSPGISSSEVARGPRGPQGEHRARLDSHHAGVREGAACTRSRRPFHSPRAEAVTGA